MKNTKQTNNYESSWNIQKNKHILSILNNIESEVSVII